MTRTSTKWPLNVCRKCRARTRWALNVRGEREQWVLLDAERITDGNIVVEQVNRCVSTRRMRYVEPGTGTHRKHVCGES